MATKPILFSGPMVRAILNGSKTQTRRVIKFPEGYRPIEYLGEYPMDEDGIDRHWWNMNLSQEAGFLPSYAVGDIIWVRETWREWDSGLCGCGGDICHCPPTGSPLFRAEINHKMTEEEYGPWKPSIFMPRKHCRLFLEVERVHPECLQSIDNDDAISEGIEPLSCPGVSLCGSDCDDCPEERDHFRELWDSLNAKRGFGWDANPWVWVYEFKVVEKPEGWPNA